MEALVLNLLTIEALRPKELQVRLRLSGHRGWNIQDKTLSVQEVSWNMSIRRATFKKTGTKLDAAIQKRVLNLDETEVVNTTIYKNEI